MGYITAILAATARHDDVALAIALAVLVAQLDQLLLALYPVNLGTLVFGKIAGGADTVLVEGDARALVRHRAFLAEPDFGRQVVLLDQISLHCFNSVTQLLLIESAANFKSSGLPTSSHGSCIG